MPEPTRGDVWLVDLDPTKGHEPAGNSPARQGGVRDLRPSSAEGATRAAGGAGPAGLLGWRGRFFPALTGGATPCRPCGPMGWSSGHDG